VTVALNDDSNDDCQAAAAGEPPPYGLYALPVMGKTAAAGRRFFDSMAPTASDSTQVRVAKEVFRVSSAVAGAAAVAIIVL
jgi:hypothetical protein